MKEHRIYLIVLLLFVLTIMCSGFVKAEESIPASTYSPEQYYYPSLNNPSNFMTWQDSFCKDSAQMDFIVELTPDACQPNPVTSDLLEEQDVPVLCRLTGVKINPFIQVPYIKRVETIVESQSKEISYINFYPARSALGYYQFEDSKVKDLAGVPTLNNLGYLVVYLKQQPIEKNMSKNVSAKIAVNITYDIAKTYGINTNQFVLPLMSQQQWMENYKKYGFWNGKGYLRVIDIKDKKAKISVYTNPSGYPLTTREITVGGDPLKIKLPGFYCQGEATITLDEVSVPKPRARIIMNGDELLVKEGEEIGESGCTLSKIVQDAYSYGGEAVVKCDNVAGSNSQGEYRLKIANSLASLKITSGTSSVTEDKSLGDEIGVKAGDKIEYYYVGYVRGTSGIGSLTSNEEIKSIVILFAKTGKAQMNDNEKTKFVRAFQDYLKNNRNVMGNNDEIKTEINKDSRIKGMIEAVVMIRGDGPESKVKIRDTEIETSSTSGLKQLYYSKEIENKYDEAIKQYRQIARQFKNQESPEGSFYGIQAYKNAAELASFMFKEKDEVLILQDLIDQYKDSADQEVMAEIDDAREMILALTYGSGDRSIAVQTDLGSYFMTLLFIERASFNSQEAKLKVDNSVVESYYLGSQIGNWIVQSIEDNDVIFSSGEATKTIKMGNTDMLAPNNKVEVVDINIQKEATVTVLPFNKEQYTTTNFSVVIGIEKRAIQLTPEQTKNRIKDLNKTIDAMNKYIKILNTTTQAWKTACYAGGTALWAKNLITGLSGESLARKIVMKAWTIRCASEDFRKQDNRIIGISECYRKNEGTINQDIASVKDVVAQANSFVKEVKETPGVILKGGIFGLSKQIDDEAFVKAAEDLFKNDASGLNAEHIDIQIELGKISRQQRQDLSAKIKNIPIMDNGNKICTDEKAKQYNLTELMGLTDSQIISDKNLKVCSIIFPVTVNTVLGNLTKLSQEGIIYTDDVKEIYYMLALNQKASSNEISKVLKDYNNVQIFSKFPYYESIIKKKVNEDNLVQKTGLNVQHYSLDSIKALTVSSIPLLSQDVVTTRFSPEDQEKIGMYVGKNKYLIIATDYEEFFVILEETTAGKFTYKKVFNVTINEQGVIQILQDLTMQQIIDKKLPPILEQDISKCKHTINKEDQNIKFWEKGPYEGFVAYMPINKADGWYFTTKAYSGVEGNLVSWKETGQLNEYWICNVGENGKPDFSFYKGPEGDDDCCYQISKTTGMEIAKEIQEIANKVETDCVPKAVDSYQKKDNPIKAGSCGTYSLGKPPVLIPSTQCEDFMSPTDCLILFNLCDPVICPPSRCDFSGRFPVDNVIQSGIVGSLLLCSGNSKEVIMPVCITGLYNGLDALNNMVFKQYAECLQKQLDTGQTTGVCDYFHSVYLCNMLWGNLDPFIKGGLPEIVSSVTKGGGEYAQFSEAIKSSEDSYQYFTSYYGASTFAAFKARSVDQKGTNICSRFVSIVTPTSAKFFEDLTKADSFYQVFASVDEIAMGGGSPESQYRVFYNIYAGQDQAVSYYVYLKKKATQSYAYEMQQLSVRDAVGFLGAGQTVAEKKDFTAPSGYNEICINVNGKDHCGFGTVSTSFAVQELQNVYLQDQIKKNIKTEQECKAGSASIVPTANFNLQSQIQEKLQPEIYRRGIVRQCASENPGASTDPSRYQRIGYCNDQKVACWLDMQSVDASISDLGIVEDITTYAENQNMKQMIDQLGLDTVEQSQSKLDDAQAKIELVEQDVNQFIDRVRKKFAQWKTIQETQTSGTSTTGNAILPITGQVISSVDDIQIEFPDANIPSNEYDSLRQKIRGTITNLLSNVLLSENLQYFPSRIDIYLGNPTSNIAGLGCNNNGLMVLLVNRNGGTAAIDGPDASTTLHEILHCIMLNKGYDLYYSIDFSNNLKTFLASTSLNKYQANTRDTLIKRLTGWGVDYLYTKNYEGGLPLIAQESFTTIGEDLYGEYVNPINKYEFPEDILTAYNGILRPAVISVGKNGQGPEVLQITGTTSGTSTTGTGRWDILTSPELLDIQNWANRETVKMGEEITKQIISLKAISEKCARPDEKARAEAYIAKLLDLRARTYSVVDIERELKWIEDQSKLKTCGDVGGTWKQTCGSNEQELRLILVTYTLDKESNAGKKCCSSITLGGTCWPVYEYQQTITAPQCSKRGEHGKCTECNIGARCFGSLRTEDGRYHAGIDLLTTNEEVVGKKVVAIEGGEITNIYPFYEGTCAVLVYNSEKRRTINYGEVGIVEGSTCSDLGEKIIKGGTILPGDKIGIIHKQTGGSAMLHLELYEGKVTTNEQWDAKQDKPSGLVDPEEFISQLQTRGIECSSPQNIASTTPDVPTDPPSSEITGEATLVINKNSGIFVESIDDNLFDSRESIRICAFIKDGAIRYSGTEVSEKNTNIRKWSGAAPTFKWYNLVALQHPSYSGAGNIYGLPAASSGERADDILQYGKQAINGNGWCIDANNNAGTYWYRAEITINGKTYSSLGKPATSSDEADYKIKYPAVNFDKYENRWDTLLEPKATENYGISPEVMRISRKSNYANSCGSSIRCIFLSTIEAFKNLPFAYGCGYYNCGEIVSGGTYTDCPTLTHLSGDFVAINCINLMIAGLSKTTKKVYTYNDFNNFILSYGEIKNGINKQKLNDIFNLHLGFGQGQLVEVGDVLFMWKESTGYTHTFIFYKDAGTIGAFDENDVVVYSSGVCPGRNDGTDADPRSIQDYNGQLCYAPIGRYKNEDSLRFTLVKINDLINNA